MLFEEKKKREKKHKDLDSSKFIELEPTIREESDELEEERQPLTIAQRRKRAMTMRRFRSKINAARKRKRKRKAPVEVLKQRARKKARGVLRTRLARNKAYGEMTPSEKMALDKRLNRIPSSTVDRIARMQLPKVKKAEIERLAALNSSFEHFSNAYLFEQSKSLSEGISSLYALLEDSPFDREQGTDSLVARYMDDTPGQSRYADFKIRDKIIFKNHSLSVYGTQDYGQPIEATIIGLTYKYIRARDDDGKLYLVRFNDAEVLHEKKLYSDVNISRRKMPQIEGSQKDFIAFLKKNDVKTKIYTVDPNVLKPTQGEFDPKKVTAIEHELPYFQRQKTLSIISSDMYILDGHHRWLAHANTYNMMDVLQIDLSVDDALELISQYPSISYKKLYEIFEYLCEEDNSCSIIPQAQMKQFETVVDQLFKKLGIDFDFTKHFRERMGDSRNTPCISLKELALMIKRLYEKVKDQAISLKSYKDTEVVLKDLISKINIPVALEYDRKDDELRVVAKTIMRKPNFHTPDKIIKI